ncbi:hypothetical protein LX87_02286 [Larkinella arboricola]|uniref:Uncharacterized protein n=1 Tax=Larkinella arboricola TaxID=643671 RepID=A0A327WX74_LARAB|nr:hypothetical protein [Larkinella arboricola]RAJ97386.1 hypothetical protein LX87_02286 [Larkinella arboricola]
MTRFDYIQTLLDDGRPEGLEEARQLLLAEIDKVLYNSTSQQAEYLAKVSCERYTTSQPKIKDTT